MKKTWCGILSRWEAIASATLRRDIPKEHRKGFDSIPAIFADFGQRAQLVRFDESGREIEPRPLTDGEFIFFFHILRKKWRKDENPKIYLSEIVELTGKSTSTIWKYLRVFERSGLIRIESRTTFSYGSKKQYVYEIDIEPFVSALIAEYEAWLAELAESDSASPYPDPPPDLGLATPPIPTPTPPSSEEKFDTLLDSISDEIEIEYRRKYGKEKEMYISQYAGVSRHTLVGRILDSTRELMGTSFSFPGAKKIILRAYKNFVDSDTEYLRENHHALAIFSKQAYNWVYPAAQEEQEEKVSASSLTPQNFARYFRKNRKYIDVVVSAYIRILPVGEKEKTYAALAAWAKKRFDFRFDFSAHPGFDRYMFFSNVYREVEKMKKNKAERAVGEPGDSALHFPIAAHEDKDFSQGKAKNQNKRRSNDKMQTVWEGDKVRPDGVGAKNARRSRNSDSDGEGKTPILPSDRREDSARAEKRRSRMASPLGDLPRASENATPPHKKKGRYNTFLKG